MKNEVYKGRKLRTVKGKEYGYVQASVNGVSLGRYQGTEEYALQQMRSTIDHVETVEFARYGIEWYAPGTAVECGECTASKAVDGPCLSQWCMGLLHAEALIDNACYDSYVRSSEVRSELAKNAPAPCCKHASMHHGARGCDTCPCTTARTAAQQDDIPEPKETNDVKPGRRATGPLTDRQEQVIDHLIAGERQRSTALIMKRSESYISAELTLAVHKLKARTAVQACSFVATSRAYLEVADLLDKSSRAHPQQDGVAEDHVNHVLSALANELRARAERLIPR